MLEAFGRLPETLEAGSSLDAVTRALSDAGLRQPDTGAVAAESGIGEHFPGCR